MFVPQDRNTEGPQAYRQPGGEADIVHQGEDVGRAEVAEREEGGEEDSRSRSHLGGLEHGENLRHLTLHTSGVEQSGGGEQDPVDSTKTGHCHEYRDEDGERSIQEVGKGDGHGLGSEDFRDTESCVESDVREDVDNRDQDDGDGDCSR